MAIADAGRPRPRHPRHRRRVLDHRLRGHAGHGDRLPHDPRLLDLRRHRRVRQGRREHAAWSAPAARMTYSDMVNLSLNQVLMRSLNTSITALLPDRLAARSSARSSSGATTLQEFALALLVGLLSGAYSSIFIASPLLAVLKEREPRVPRRPRGASRPATRRRRRPRRPPPAAAPSGADDAGDAASRRRPAAAGRRAGAPTPPGRLGDHPAAAPQEGQAAVTVDARRRPGCEDHIRDIPDFPKPGVVFKDITPLLADADGVPLRRRRHRRPTSPAQPSTGCVGIEARGLHRRRAGRLPARRRLRPGPQGRASCPWRDRAAGVRARVRHRPARDPPRRASRPASGC